jgi:hypothetical protein
MGKRPSVKPSSPTPYEHFLFLLIEMEHAVEGGRIRWPAGQAEHVQWRLLAIVRKLAQASDLPE